MSATKASAVAAVGLIGVLITSGAQAQSAGGPDTEITLLKEQLRLMEQKLEKLHEQMAPLQNEINQLNRQFWVNKDKVKAHKYDLSASRYRQIEQDAIFYEQPHVTLNRLRQLETMAIRQVCELDEMLGDDAIQIP